MFRVWLLIALLSPFGATAAAVASADSILVLGDSISAGYGIPQDRGWVTLLQQRLRQRGLDYAVVNASISGETTDGGRRRLAKLLQTHQPKLVIVELGGNDGLRGFQLERLRENLAFIIEQSRQAGAKVLLVGMKIPPNYGLRYTSGFYASFTDTAKQFDVPLVPFLLEGIATHPELMQDDRIHPNTAAQPQLLDNVWPLLEPMLRQVNREHR